MHFVHIHVSHNSRGRSLPQNTQAAGGNSESNSTSSRWAEFNIG
ncbi:MAG TPA: hypothetical protein VJN64_15175 [Terriglobales bacterium]|nr:hypothetical protein [Terriglobales bacterium]